MAISIFPINADFAAEGATDNKKLEEIYAEINKLEKTEIEEFKYYNYEEKYRILVLLALGLLMLEWIGRNTLFKSFI